jgi:hypothetical protein
MRTWKLMGVVALLALAACGAEVPDRPGNFVIVRDDGAAPRCELLVRRDSAEDIRIDAKSCEMKGPEVTVDAGLCGRLVFREVRSVERPAIGGGTHACLDCPRLGHPLPAPGCALDRKAPLGWQVIEL